MHHQPLFAAGFIIVAHVLVVCQNVTPNSAYTLKPSIDPAKGLKLQPGDTAKLKCRTTDANVDMSWQRHAKDGSWPTVQNGTRTAISFRTETNDGSGGTEATRTVSILDLSIERIEASDMEDYRCYVEDKVDSSNYNYNSVPLDVGNFIHFPKYMKPLSEVRPKKRYTLWIDYRSNPDDIQTYWTKDDSEDPLVPSEKYNFTIAEDTAWKRASLIISNLTIDDMGNYTLHVANGVENRPYTRTLPIVTIPKLTMGAQNARPNQTVRFSCTSVGYPASTIRFRFFPCSAESWANCSRAFDPWQVNQHGTTIDDRRSHVIVEQYAFNASSPGFVVCQARNKEGNATITADLLISELDAPVVITLESPEREVTVGDNVTIDCAAPVYNTTAIEFYRGGVPIPEAGQGISFENRYEDFAYKRRMTLSNVWKAARKEVIECRAFGSDEGRTEMSKIAFLVHEPVEPTIRGGDKQEDVELKVGETHRLECDAEGVPKPLVLWVRDEQVIANGSVLEVRGGTANVSGEYFCRARNKVGSVEKRWTLTVRTVVIRTAWLHAGISLLVILVVVVIIVLFFYLKKRRQVKLLEEQGLVHFEDGDINQLNQAIPLVEQSDCLPYQRRQYEFPETKLTLGHRVGGGAFGVVLVSTARGIKKGEAETTVAVKMGRDMAEAWELRSLVAELKILILLGKHLNVVNLMGAVTKNLVRRDLKIIMEYCPLGNLQQVLRKCDFIDQINCHGEIDHTIGEDVGSQSSLASSPALKVNGKPAEMILVNVDHFIDKSRKSSCSDQTTSESFLSGRNDTVEAPLIQPSTSGYVMRPPSPKPADSIEHPLIRPSASGYVSHPPSPRPPASPIAGPSRQPTASGYINRSPSPNPAKPSSPTDNNTSKPKQRVTTTDLLCWAYQIAAGMEHVAAQKILHGDLAARNVLLCEGNVVKICDFGLSRSLYGMEWYKKTGTDPIPYRWAALECIDELLYSTFSDVWSYGVLLWELFSRGINPYPDVDDSKKLFDRLRTGYRMHIPQYANGEIYSIMEQCWAKEPKSRPVFSVLKKLFSDMLPEHIPKHFEELNQPYVKENLKRAKHKDFKRMFSKLPPVEVPMRHEGLAPYVNTGAGQGPPACSENQGYDPQESHEEGMEMAIRVPLAGPAGACNNPGYMVGVAAV